MHYTCRIYLLTEELCHLIITRTKGFVFDCRLPAYCIGEIGNLLFVVGAEDARLGGSTHRRPVLHAFTQRIISTLKHTFTHTHTYTHSHTDKQTHTRAQKHADARAHTLHEYEFSRLTKCVPLYSPKHFQALNTRGMPCTHVPHYKRI